MNKIKESKSNIFPSKVPQRTREKCYRRSRVGENSHRDRLGDPVRQENCRRLCACTRTAASILRLRFPCHSRPVRGRINSCFDYYVCAIHLKRLFGTGRSNPVNGAGSGTSETKKIFARRRWIGDGAEVRSKTGTVGKYAARCCKRKRTREDKQIHAFLICNNRSSQRFLANNETAQMYTNRWLLCMTSSKIRFLFASFVVSFVRCIEKTNVIVGNKQT